VDYILLDFEQTKILIVHRKSQYVAKSKSWTDRIKLD